MNSPSGNKNTYYTLSNGHGLDVVVCDFGARIVSVKTPDKHGCMEEITLGYINPEDYLTDEAALGATVGPVANRIAKSQCVIDGIAYQFEPNEGANHLHSAAAGIHRQQWLRVDDGESTNSILLECKHADGVGNYPGNVVIKMQLSLTDQQEMIIHYMATTDRPTPVNITNHNYWNLAGKGQIFDHQLLINAEQYLELDDDNIPTGNLLAVDHSDFIVDGFNPLTNKGEQWDGIDHYFVTNSDDNTVSASLYHPSSGRYLELSTQSLGIQCYTGQGLAEEFDKSAIALQPFAGLCLEAQSYPDATSHSHFPSIILYPGQLYSNRLRYAFGVR